MTIQIITIDEENGLIDRQEIQPSDLQQETMSLFDCIPDTIYIRPDWPPLGSPDFATMLRAWHAAHNPETKRE